MTALEDPSINKGMAFTKEHRKMLCLQGLLPPTSFPLETEEQRALVQLNNCPSPLDKYIYLMGLQVHSELLLHVLIS